MHRKKKLFCGLMNVEKAFALQQYLLEREEYKRCTFTNIWNFLKYWLFSTKKKKKVKKTRDEKKKKKKNVHQIKNEMSLFHWPFV